MRFKDVCLGAKMQLAKFRSSILGGAREEAGTSLGCVTSRFLGFSFEFWRHGTGKC